MQTLPITSIIVKDRQRKEIGPKKLEELKRGILSKGLLHPIVLSLEPDGTYRLRAGERRLRAMSDLHTEGHTFTHNGEPVPEDHVPYVLTGDLAEDDLYELELEENLLRENLTWMEEVEARAALHELRKKQNPGQTISETGKELAEIKSIPAVTGRDQIHRAVLLAANKDNPRVKKAKTESEAFKALLDESEQQWQAKLAQAEKNIKSPHQLINADCREAFSQIQNGTISTIICDPPYGIEANQAGQDSKHFYNDSPEYALEICRFIIREGFAKCTPRAILFMFCDIDHFVTLKTYAAQQAWSVFRTPIIWNKEVSGRAPWGRAGFQRSYEILLFAVKGQDELVIPGGLDILSFKQDSAKNRTHAANKPVALIEHLIKISTLPGELVLDPCCGSGVIFTAATRSKVRAIGIELDPTYHAQAVNRLAGGESPSDEVSDLGPALIGPDGAPLDFPDL